MNVTSRIADIIIAESYQTGIDPQVALDIAQLESSLNPNAVGDNGTSFGLFQLHRGGLAPDKYSDSQLQDPALNADIAIRHMKGNYDKGRGQGLTGYELTAYVANNSGWPGGNGVAWTDRNRPDYNSRLRTIYGKSATEGYIASYEGSQSPGPVETTAITDATTDTSAYADDTNQSAPARVFRSMAEGEQFESWSDWAEGRDWYEKILPFSYMTENARPVGVRFLVAIVGLLFILFAVMSIVRQNNPMMPTAAGPAPGVPGETPLELPEGGATE